MAIWNWWKTNIDNVSTIVTGIKRKPITAIFTQKLDFLLMLSQKKGIIDVTRRKRFFCCDCLVVIYCYRYLKYRKYVVLVLVKSSHEFPRIVQ